MYAATHYAPQRIAHAQLGMLVVEVKGGRISVSDGARDWKSTDRHGITHNIKNPVAQARTGKHQLLDKLKDSADWTPRYINARHGVILPDSRRPARDMAPDMPLQIFAFDEEMDHLDTWVRNRLGGQQDDELPGRCKPLGPEGIRALEVMLSRGFELRVSSIRAIEQDAADIRRLTEEQIHILRDLDENRRMAIAGAAGTGKTVLAVQKSLDCAGKDLDTLLVCYNEALAEQLRRRLGNVSQLTICTFHSLCNLLTREARLPVLTSPVPDMQYFEVTLPDLMLEALTRLPGRRFDAIIVDEAQDFADNWLVCLECALRSREHGIFYVFYDNNQRVARKNGSFLAGMPVSRYRLSRNFRNTRRIFELVRHFYVGDPVQAVGPVGQEMQFISYGRDLEDVEALRQQLGLLMSQERIPADRSTILVANQSVRDRIVRNSRIGRYEVCDAASSSVGRVTIDTVRRFKGLDSQVVILFRPEDYLDEPELLYTAISRAMVRLVVVGSPDALEFLQTSTDRA